MEQKTLLKIIVVGVVLFFMLETIAMVVIGNPSKNNTIERYEGSGTVKVMVVNYYPYLIVPEGMDETLKKEVLTLDGVERVEDKADGTVVSVKSSKYVFPLYQFLKEKGIVAYTKAQVYFPGEVNLGDKTAFIQGGITLMLEPFVNENQKLTMFIRAVVENGRVVGIYELKPVSEVKEISLKGNVEKEIGKKYVIFIPWENRTVRPSDLGIEDEQVEYNKNNYVVIKSQKPITEKKEYVTAIGEGVIIVKEDFTNKTAVFEDYSYYGDITFPDSLMFVLTNKTLENISFQVQEYRFYSVRVRPENYTYHEIIMGYESPAPLEIGEEIRILANATVSGNVILSLE